MNCYTMIKSSKNVEGLSGMYLAIHGNQIVRIIQMYEVKGSTMENDPRCVGGSTKICIISID